MLKWVESDEEPLNEDVNSPSDKSSQWAALNNSEERSSNVPELQNHKQLLYSQFCECEGFKVE